MTYDKTANFLDISWNNLPHFQAIFSFNQNNIPNLALRLTSGPAFWFNYLGPIK